MVSIWNNWVNAIYYPDKLITVGIRYIIFYNIYKYCFNILDVQPCENKESWCNDNVGPDCENEYVKDRCKKHCRICYDDDRKPDEGNYLL